VGIARLEAAKGQLRMMKPSPEKRDIELRHVMAEEGSRGRLQPVHVVNLEYRRTMRHAAELLADPNCEREHYVEAIRDHLGLPDGSPEFLLFLKAWEECH
jgi:hypothetical protein